MGSPRDCPVKADSSRRTEVMKEHNQAVMKVGAQLPRASSAGVFR